MTQSEEFATFDPIFHTNKNEEFATFDPIFHTKKRHNVDYMSETHTKLLSCLVSLTISISLFFIENILIICILHITPDQSQDSEKK